MQIDVEHVARLARLGLTEEEKRTYAQQISAILEYAENLTKLNTEDIPPTAHAIPLKNVLREDRAIPCQNIDAILSNAPEEDKHMFKVPRILE